MNNKDIWIIIPACNEEKNIDKIIKKTKKYSKNIVLVDDGSKDKTYDISKKNNIIVLRHMINLGKGAALKTGCDFAIKNGAKKIVVLDADGQHDPKEIPNFLKELNGNDIIFGYRMFDRKMPFILKFGNMFINALMGFLFDIRLKDSQCGYRAFTNKAYKKIRWKAADYSMESEMVANAGKKRLKYKEVPIGTIYSDKYKGTTILDGVKIVFNILFWRLNRWS